MCGGTWDFQLAQTTVPNKCKELMGLGVPWQMHPQYCANSHTGAAKLRGATEAEIRKALGIAMGTARLSTCIAGTGYDVVGCKQETDHILDHVRRQARKRAALPGGLPPGAAGWPGPVQRSGEVGATFRTTGVKSLRQPGRRQSWVLARCVVRDDAADC